MSGNSRSSEIALCYIARGADDGWRESVRRFVRSYSAFEAGVEHRLSVVFKGFENQEALDEASDLLGKLSFDSYTFRDDAFDIGAYIKWGKAVSEDRVCMLNTASEILCENWLKKMSDNLNAPNVGLVGASGSYESLNKIHHSFPDFPNVHIRSTAFMLRTELFKKITSDIRISDKMSAYQFESGADGLTARVAKMGLETLIVGKNGRGYSPEWWTLSDTFRQSRQLNLMVGDNQTRAFDAMMWSEKLVMTQQTWNNSSV